MIIDKINNLDRYSYVPGVKKAVDFIKNNDLLALAVGKYDLGDDCVLKVFEYQTKEIPEEDIPLEAHREYLDLQIAIKGEETMFFQAIDLGEEYKPYNEEKDVEFFTSAWTNQLVLNGDNFALIFPNDLHIANYVADEVCDVKKLVFKLKIG